MQRTEYLGHFPDCISGDKSISTNCLQRAPDSVYDVIFVCAGFAMTVDVSLNDCSYGTPGKDKRWRSDGIP